MKFTKAGQVRIEQLRDEIRRNVIEFPQMAIQWNGVDGIDIEDIDGKATDNQTALQVVVDNHIPSMEYFEDEKRAVNTADAQARFLLSQLANKTPEEIYTMMQGRMDSWGSLANAKADLREWLPLMAAILAWKVV